MKNSILVCVSAILLLACQKSEFNDLGGSQILKGIAVVHDTLQGTDSMYLLRNGKVFIRNLNSGSGFLYSVTTDSSGLFTFSGIDPDSSYAVFGRLTMPGIAYYGINTYPNGSFDDKQSDTLHLYFDASTTNGIHLIARDELGQPVPDQTAWVFNNATLFANDINNGRIYDIAINRYGVGNQFSVAPGRYYIRINAQIGNLALAGETAIEVNERSLSTAIITLQNGPQLRNGMEITVSDRYATPVNGASLFVYRSRLLFETDTVHYNNYLFQLNSNPNGLCSAYILEPGEYFLRARRIINSDTLKATTNIIVPNNSIVASQITLP